ncbi:pupal cuticle protein PCP52-like [Pieris napi]|uniref:pupal cuticle protein PCP52-like n=1 Tax=Pieris napi TaxID=78633 RepID=UPI001FB8B37B|nr:pupal cuticle protein PCP52-like [Pieris napi]
MRVLVLSALFACAAAAPSYLNLPIVGPIVTFAAPLTVPAGDVQAAVINAQVRLTDEARAIADQARELQEQVIENRNEGVIEANDLAKEKSEELFWSAEEKKWQALEATQTAEAALDGTLSNNAENIAKSAMEGNVANVAEVVAAPAEVAAKEEVAEAKSEIKTEDKEVKVEAKAAEAPESPKEEMAKDAVQSVVHPIPVGLAPISYQAINPVGYAQIGLRALPFPIPVRPYYNPVFNTLY